MMKRSLFLSAILLAGLALAAPAHAGSLTIGGTFSVPGGQTGELEFFFSAPVTGAVIDAAIPAVSSVSYGSNYVDVFYSPSQTAGSLTFTAMTTGAFLGGFTAEVTGSPTGNHFNFNVLTVPEPSSMALLGIGMTGDRKSVV